MRLPVSVATPLSQTLARLHGWYATAGVLSSVRLASLDSTSIGRLRYALMMANRDRPAACRRLFDRVLRANQGTTPELSVEMAVIATAMGLEATAVDLLRQAQGAPETADLATKLLHTLRASADGTLQQTLGQAVGALSLPPGAAVTLVPVSGRYLQLWQLWLGQVRLHVPGEVLALVMDDAAWSALDGEPGVHRIDLRNHFSWSADGRIEPHSRGVLWYLRVLLLRELVRRGSTVTVLDLDAVPVGDLQPLLDSLPEADVIAQQDHSIPVDVDRALGFVLCCGFMVWRPGAATTALLDRFSAEAALERDDQTALNHLLARNGLSNQHTAREGTHFESAGVHFAMPSPALVSRSLDSGSVIRHFHQTGKGLAELQTALGLSATSAVVSGSSDGV